MSEILSQSEIDALLAELNSGEPMEEDHREQGDSPKIRLYDFKTANKFPKEQIRTINIVFQTYGQLLANYLSGSLRTSCEVEMVSIEELTFSEFNNSLPTPVILAIVSMPPLEGSILLQLSTEVVYICVNRLLGGGRTNMENGKTFTEIERAITERVVRQMLRLMDEAWAKVIRIRSMLDRIETSNQFAQIVDMNEPVAIITFDLKIGDDSGIINICIPHMAIEPVAKQLNTRLWYSGEQSKKVIPQTDNISRKLLRTEVTLHAVFHETTATVNDVANLQVGDVIQLEHRVEEPVTVLVQNIPKFTAQIGKKGLSSAVKIVDIIKGSEDVE